MGDNYHQFQVLYLQVITKLFKDAEKIPVFKHTFLNPPGAFCPNHCSCTASPQEVLARFGL